MSLSGKEFVPLPGFDPRAGTTIRVPRGLGKGYWVGAPSAFYSPNRQKFYLACRWRNAHQDHPSRGFQCEIAESRDGVHFDSVAALSAASLGTPSIEKSALIEDAVTGTMRLYVSYVDPKTSRWRIDLFQAARPEDLPQASPIPVLSAEQLNSEGVKDPCVFRVAGQYYMLASYLPNFEGVTAEDLHQIQDASAIGLTQVYTALLQSADGLHFHYVRDFLSPGSHWDRLSTVATTVMLSAPWFVVFFDGRRDASDSYEGKAGLAVTTDFEHVYKLDVFQPRFRSPHASGCLRYVDVVQTSDADYFYYEYAREDGSHELRVNKVTRESFYS